MRFRMGVAVDRRSLDVGSLEQVIFRSLVRQVVDGYQEVLETGYRVPDLRLEFKGRIPRPHKD